MSFLDSTQLTLEAAMSGSMVRQTLLTNNLANADTPNYQPQDVNFQQTLASAIQDGQPLDQLTYQPYTATQVNGPDGNGVDAQQTSAEVAENGLLYQELVQVAAAREGILQTAINSSTP
ncbi:MAG: flagellar basal body rod protein FlgB [Solirubrobacteraceae bacterium]